MVQKKEAQKKESPKKKPQRIRDTRPVKQIQEQFKKAAEEFQYEQAEFDQNLREWGIIRPEPLRGRGARKKAFEKDPKILFDLQQALLVGMTIDAACIFAGITRDQYHEWIRNHPNVSTLLKKIEHSGQLHHLKRIFLGKANWQSSAWWLERKYKKDWYLRKEEDHQEKEFRVVFEGAKKDVEE